MSFDGDLKKIKTIDDALFCISGCKSRSEVKVVIDAIDEAFLSDVSDFFIEPNEWPLISAAVSKWLKDHEESGEDESTTNKMRVLPVTKKTDTETRQVQINQFLDGLCISLKVDSRSLAQAFYVLIACRGFWDTDGEMDFDQPKHRHYMNFFDDSLAASHMAYLWPNMNSLERDFLKSLVKVKQADDSEIDTPNWIDVHYPRGFVDRLRAVYSRAYDDYAKHLEESKEKAAVSESGENCEAPAGDEDKLEMAGAA